MPWSRSGVVIRGGTPHFDYVCSAATDGLTRVALDTGHARRVRRAHLRRRRPGPRPGRARGLAEDKGYEATAAALLTARTLAALRG